MARQPRTTAYLVTGLALFTSAPGCGGDVPTRKTDAAPASRPAAPASRPAVPDNRSIDGISFSFSPRSLLGDNRKPPFFGPQASLTVTRAGKVRYSYASRPETGSGGKTVVKEWDVPPAEAAELLDGLVADGLLAAEIAIQFTGHHYTVWYGRWQLTSTPLAMPPGAVDRLLPLVEKAHPDWKTDAYYR